MLLATCRDIDMPMASTDSNPLLEVLTDDQVMLGQRSAWEAVSVRAWLPPTWSCALMRSWS